MLKIFLATVVVFIVVLTAALIRTDYERFVSILGLGIPTVLRIDTYQLSLGPGGTPQTLGGYLRVKFLGLFALRDPYHPALLIPNEHHSKTGYLSHLIQRQHPRPKTEGVAPHRQTSQIASKEIFSKLAFAIEAFAPGANNDLIIGTSCFEKHGTGLFSTCPANQTCKGEVLHVHPSDGSMHLTLHPADANIVLGAEWGERHPLAGVFWGKFLPEGFMMLYAPQNEQDVDIVLEVARAACWYVCKGNSASIDGEEKCQVGGGGLDRQVEDPGNVLRKM